MSIDLDVSHLEVAQDNCFELAVAPELQDGRPEPDIDLRMTEHVLLGHLAVVSQHRA
jgi:hypothetical protein